MLNMHFHRRNLPHLYYSQGIYFITYRLYGSIPQSKIAEFHKMVAANKGLSNIEIFNKYDILLDRQSNNLKYLSIPEIADVCKKPIHHFDGKLYKLICYCIMPNHVHLVIELSDQKKPLGDITGSIKKYSAREANKILNRKGAFWQAESFDRLIRDADELYYVIRYTLFNPFSAGLIDDYKHWPHTYCHPDYTL